MPEAAQNRPPQTRSRLATCLGSRDRFRRRRFCRIWCVREADALAGWNTNSANCENVSRFGRGTGGGQVTTSAVRLQYFRPDSQGWRSGCRDRPAPRWRTNQWTWRAEPVTTEDSFVALVAVGLRLRWAMAIVEHALRDESGTPFLSEPTGVRAAIALR